MYICTPGFSRASPARRRFKRSPDPQKNFEGVAKIAGRERITNGGEPFFGARGEGGGGPYVLPTSRLSRINPVFPYTYTFKIMEWRCFQKSLLRVAEEYTYYCYSVETTVATIRYSSFSVGETARDSVRARLPPVTVGVASPVRKHTHVKEVGGKSQPAVTFL